jgi:hypothetical protein
VRILFDEDAPRPLRRHLVGHEIITVQEVGWAGIKNGELLRLTAENASDVLLTFDQNLRYQQNLAQRPLALVVIIAPNKKINTLTPIVPRLLEVLSRAEPGQVYLVNQIG